MSVQVYNFDKSFLPEAIELQDMHDILYVAYRENRGKGAIHANRDILGGEVSWMPAFAGMTDSDVPRVMLIAGRDAWKNTLAGRGM